MRSIDMTTALVWTQSWGKAEVVTGMPICSVFEEAARNRSRGCESARTRRQATRMKETAVRVDGSSLVSARPRRRFNPGRDMGGTRWLREAMIRTDVV